MHGTLRAENRFPHWYLRPFPPTNQQYRCLTCDNRLQVQSILRGIDIRYQAIYINRGPVPRAKLHSPKYVTDSPGRLLIKRLDFVHGSRYLRVHFRRTKWKEYVFPVSYLRRKFLVCLPFSAFCSLSSASRIVWFLSFSSGGSGTMVLLLLASLFDGGFCGDGTFFCSGNMKCDLIPAIPAAVLLLLPLVHY